MLNEKPAEDLRKAVAATAQIDFMRVYALLLTLLLGFAPGCKKSESESLPPSSRPAAKPAISIEESSTPAAPAAPAPEAAPAEAVDAPPPPTGTSLNAEARKQRNLAWLKILKTGTAEQKQKVQDQLTNLSSDELSEITVLYEKQEKLR